MLGKRINIQGYNFKISIVGNIHIVDTRTMTYKRVGDVEEVIIQDGVSFEEGIQFVEDCRDALERLGNPL